MTVRACARCGFGSYGLDPLTGERYCPVCGSRVFSDVTRDRWRCRECGKVSKRPVMVVDAWKGIHYDGCRGWD